MDDSFTIQISSKLVNRLAASDGENIKKKTKRSKAKIPPRGIPHSPVAVPKKGVFKGSEALKGTPPEGRGVKPPVFLPLSPRPPPIHGNVELDAIKSVLENSEKVVERLQKHEEGMVKKVTEKATNLHDKEFKLPSSKPVPCLNEISACSVCYKENAKDLLKCAQLVKNFADCANSARQQQSS